MNTCVRRMVAVIAIISSLWFAPAVHGSSCPRQLPSKYIPVLRLAEPINHKALDVGEKGRALEIRNLAPDALVLRTLWTHTPHTTIDPATTFTIDMHNAGAFIEKTPDMYCSDGGVPDGATIPPNIPTQFTVQVEQKMLNVSVNIVYEENPQYARDLRNYQEYEKSRKAYGKALLIVGIVYFVGYAGLIIAGIIGAIFLLRWMLRRAEERWE